MITQLKLYLASLISILLCFIIQDNLQLGTVLTSAGVAFIMAFFINDQEIKSIVYIGTFCAMGGAFQNGHIYIYAIFMSLLNIILFRLFKFHFVGHGGKLGTLALLSTLIVFLVEEYAFH